MELFPTDANPADHATRAIPDSQLILSSLLTGPPFLTDKQHCHSHQGAFNLINPKSDVKLHPEEVTCITHLSNQPESHTSLILSHKQKKKALAMGGTSTSSLSVQIS